jgi:hypothetical protein
LLRGTEGPSFAVHQPDLKWLERLLPCDLVDLLLGHGFILASGRLGFQVVQAEDVDHPEVLTFEPDWNVNT